MTTAPTPLSRRQTQHPLTHVLLGALVGAAIVSAIVLAIRHEGVGLNSSSVIQGSGTGAVQARVVAPFSALDLGGSNNVSVHVGGKQSVVVRGDDNLLEYVTTKVGGGVLRIEQSRSFSTRSPMSVEVTVPALDSLSLSGSGILSAENVRGDALRVRLPGSGTLTVGGEVARLDAALAGSGRLRLQGLVARDVSAEVSGSGMLEVDATHSLDASVSGSGEITYSGNPTKVTRSVTGSGVILGH